MEWVSAYDNERVLFMKKLWYAIQKDSTDEWGTGSFDYDEAVRMAKKNKWKYIAVIDGDYDENGDPTTDPICIEEIEVDLTPHPITQLREITGMSRAEMSRRYNIPVRTLENWEAGVAEAPDYTIDLLARAVLEDSGRYEEVLFTITEITDDRDESETFKTASITEAIRRAKSDWDFLTAFDKKHTTIESRIYELSEKNREESDNWDHDLIEWKG